MCFKLYNLILMASLNPIEKLQLEKAFVMGGGYVLNFSNYSFRSFIADIVGIDIDDPKYSQNGGSKANRLRAFWSLEADLVVGKLLNALLNYNHEARELHGPPITEEELRVYAKCEAISRRLLGIAERPARVVPSAKGVSPEVRAVLNDKLLKLSALSPQERGYAFERFLQELFSAYELNPKAPFRLAGEQIDGSLELDGEIYLIEAKWQNSRIDSKELYAFYGKIEGKAAWSRGLFISYSGFSRESLEALAKGKRPNFITLDGQDLNFVLAGEHGEYIDLQDCIRKKVRYAAETGVVNLSAYEILKGKA